MSKSRSRNTQVHLLNFHTWDYGKCTLAIVGALACSACADNKVTSPRNSRIMEAAPNASHQLTGGTFSLAIPGNSAAPLLGGAPWQATGIKVRRGVNVRSRMPMTMIATYNPPPPEPWSCIPWNIPEGEVNPGGNAPPLQWNLGIVRFTVTSDSVGTVGANPALRGAGWNRAGDGSWTSVDYIGTEVSDSGFLSFRRFEIDGECNGYIKYNLAGSQTITVDFPEIQVSRDRAVVLPGAPVQFAATASGFTPSTPSWAWKWTTGNQ